MSRSPLISAADLSAQLGAANWLVVDCRFSLADTERGRREYARSHIPGAVYAHIDEHLSGPVIPGVTGRHPLPDPAVLAVQLGQWGIDADTTVVAYDDAGGGHAARLWWLLGWLGHDHAYVLDGGWQAWQAAGYPETEAVPQRNPTTFTPRLRPERVVDAHFVKEKSHDPDFIVADSRDPQRYAGLNETIDPIAGHIPGAVSAPYMANLSPDGRFQDPEALRLRFEKLLEGKPADHSVFYCGSGVTACHNLLAYAHAGLGDALLYAGSWSEWINDPERGVKTGPGRE
ncbi:MAG: sulfurtransferase [Saprospiraceae bacterium]|nr:sulfurtransferase [Saprospiraceae bacterium]